MKLKYHKPTIVIESFTLLEHIASCNANNSATYLDASSGCSYSDATLVIYTEESCEGMWISPYVYDSFEDFRQAVEDTEDFHCYNAFSNGDPFAS